MRKTVRMFSYLLLLGCLVALGACGAKGDLFLPAQAIKKAIPGAHLKPSDQPASGKTDSQTQSDTQTQTDADKSDQPGSEPEQASDLPAVPAQPDSPTLQPKDEDKEDKTVQ